MGELELNMSRLELNMSRWIRCILLIMFMVLIELTTQNLLADISMNSDNTFLAIDNTVFEKMDGLSLGLCEAKKYIANPVLEGTVGAPDEYRAGFCQVFLDNGKFRMYYTAFDNKNWNQCYAESKDGYHWQKPVLGIKQYNGRDSNIVSSGFGMQLVYFDNQESDPEKRYKSAVFGMITDKYFNEAEKKRYGKSAPSIKCFATSPDGIHWKLDSSNLFPVHAKVEGGTLYRMHGRWFMTHQMISGDYPQVEPWSRFIGVSSSTDFKKWQLAPAPGFFLDPKYSGIIQTHMTPVYQDYGNVLVACQGLFRNNNELIDHETDLMILLTDDGFHWRQPIEYQPLNLVLRRGDQGSWDASFIVQGGLINAGHETRLYYSGSPGGGNANGRDMKIGVASLRLDGYGYLAPTVQWSYSKKSFEGIALSKPILIKEKGLMLYLNLKGTVNKGDEVKVELQNEKGQPLSGFTFDECENIIEDSVGIPVIWKKSLSLNSLIGKKVRVKIRIRALNPEQRPTIRANMPALYAFYFDKPTLWRGAKQRVFPGRGLERVQYQDMVPSCLEGIKILSDSPVEVSTTELTQKKAVLRFSGKAKVKISSPRIKAVYVNRKAIRPKGSMVTFPVSRGTVVTVIML